MSSFKMKKLVVSIVISLILGACLEVVHSSSIDPDRRASLVHHLSRLPLAGARRSRASSQVAPEASLGGQSETISVSQLANETPNNPGQQGNTVVNGTTTATSTTPATTTSTTHDPNSDLDEPMMPPNLQDNSTNKVPSKDDPGGGGGGGDKNSNKGNQSASDNQSGSNDRINSELSVLWYSVFMVYVSFVKLIYHNVSMIKRNLTEPG